jgi:hypothetical protein
MEPDIDIDDIKIKINTIIWMYGPKGLTLEEAEERAVEIYFKIKSSPKEV